MQIQRLPGKGCDKYVKHVFKSINGKATPGKPSSYLMSLAFITVVVSLGIVLFSLCLIPTGKVLSSSKTIMMIAEHLENYAGNSIKNYHEEQGEIPNLDKEKKVRWIQPSIGRGQSLQNDRSFDYKCYRPVKSYDFFCVTGFSNGLAQCSGRILPLETKLYIKKLMSWCWLSECVPKVRVFNSI